MVSPMVAGGGESRLASLHSDFLGPYKDTRGAREGYGHLNRTFFSFFFSYQLSIHPILPASTLPPLNGP